MFVIWKRTILICSLILASSLYGAERKAVEILLSQTENAYNPVPNPDGTIIAYVRTGWWRPGGTGGFGRSNLRSEVMLMNTDGQLLVKEPLVEAFLAGWTSDGKNLICYRDWFYYLVSPNGTIIKQIDQPKGFPPKIELPERVSYLSDIDSFIWVKSVLGAAIISPGDSYASPSWNPWFADSSRLTFVSPSGIVVSSPNGKERAVLAKPTLQSGLAAPSPDGQFVAYVTFEPRPLKGRPDLKFWGGTSIWIVSTREPRNARRITELNQDTTYCLRWLNNRQLIFDRIADESFYEKARLWKVDVF